MSHHELWKLAAKIASGVYSHARAIRDTTAICDQEPIVAQLWVKHHRGLRESPHGILSCTDSAVVFAKVAGGPHQASRRGTTLIPLASISHVEIEPHRLLGTRMRLSAGSESFVFSGASRAALTEFARAIRQRMPAAEAEPCATKAAESQDESSHDWSGVAALCGIILFGVVVWSGMTCLACKGSGACSSCGGDGATYLFFSCADCQATGRCASCAGGGQGWFRRSFK